MQSNYDSLLIVSFGGPEKPDDVIPFLENVLRGRNVPRERMLEVAEHYELFGGVSPLNAQVRALIAALRVELDAHDIGLPIYWGNRNWHPLLSDTLREMAAAGRQRSLAFVTAAYSSYSSCRQYREDIERARAAVGAAAPQVDKLRVFFNHPQFITANADHLAQAFRTLPAERQKAARVAFTAHSIPVSMARTCQYEPQLQEACRLVAAQVGLPAGSWQLVYQSRSGRPQDPWLEPDLGEHLRALHAAGVRDVVVMPIGFLSDHMEVVYDLDVEAKSLADELGLHLVRSATVGTHPAFVSMIRQLIQERLAPSSARPALGEMPAGHDVCPADCCPGPVRPGPRANP